MTKKIIFEKHVVSAIVIVIILVVLDLFIPGFDLFGFRLGRVATASLVVDYGQGRTRQFAGEVTNEMSVFDAFMASSIGGLKVDYAHKGRELTFFSVDGRTGELKIKVNDHPVQVEKLNETPVTQGDWIRVELP